VASVPEPPAVGEPAPLFNLTSVQGGPVELAAYRGRRNVVVWFSRGFTCPFCRVYMDGMREGYELLQAADAEIIQVGPNLLQSARIFFGHSPTPYPFVCDPDKRLFAVYGLGDRGALEATRSAVVSFSYAFTHGDTGPPWRYGAPASGRLARRHEPEFRPPAAPPRHDRHGAGHLPGRP